MAINRIRPDVDVVKDLLKAVQQARPDSQFIQSLSVQYDERGGLSKKQLQGLYQKACKIEGIPANKLATLEAIIAKKPTRFKSTLPEAKPLYERDDQTGAKLDAILSKYPRHKRALFLKSKFENHEVISASEITEIEKFFKMLG